MRATNIYLEERHREWLDRHSMNFSKFVRKIIDAEMAKEGKVVKRFIVKKWLAEKRNIPQEIEGLEKRVTSRAVLVEPVDEMSEEVWLPKSQLEKVEPVGPYEEGKEYPKGRGG